MKIEVTEAQIFPVKPHEGRIAFASCVINGWFYLGNLAVITRLNEKGKIIKGKYRVSYPSRMVKNTPIPIFHPIRKEVTDEIEKVITQKVNEIFNY